MTERIFDKSYWLSSRKAIKGNGQGHCKDWCEGVLKEEKVAQMFSVQRANLGKIQIDQYATSILVHYWLETKDDIPFIVDGTAGQFDPQYPEGYYGPIDQASHKLKEIYSRREKIKPSTLTL